MCSLLSAKSVSLYWVQKTCSIGYKNVVPPGRQKYFLLGAKSISFWVPKMWSFLGTKGVFPFGCQKGVSSWAPKVCHSLGCQKCVFLMGAKYVFPNGCQKCLFLWVPKMCPLMGAKNVLLSGHQMCAYFTGAKNVFNHRRRKFRLQEFRVALKICCSQ